MPNVARHIIGGALGLVALALVLFVIPRCVMEVTAATARMAFTLQLALAVVPIIAIGLGLGALAGSRLSPVGALVCGIPSLAFGLAAMVPPLMVYLPSEMMVAGVPLLVIGAVLTLSAVFPHRWRPARPARVPTQHVSPHGQGHIQHPGASPWPDGQRQ